MMLITVKRWGTEELLKRKKTNPNIRKTSWLHMSDLVFLNCDFSSEVHSVALYMFRLKVSLISATFLSAQGFCKSGLIS